MATEKPKPRYIFENPNTPHAVEQILKKIVLEKILSSSAATLYKVTNPQ